MADTLKQFSSHSGKTHTEMKAGVTLASTTGSQTAVIKDVHITNENNRNVEIRLGSTTGQRIVNCGGSGNYNGNEILDNSQSLVATTNSYLVASNFVQRGWGSGQFEENEHTYNGSRQIQQHIITGTPVWSPQNWNGIFNITSTDMTPYKNLPLSSGNDVSIKCPSDSFFDASGNLFAWSCASEINFQINGTTRNGQVVYRIASDAANSRTTNLTQLGNEHDHDIVVWDGSRYFYTMRHDHNYMRKYDTQTMGANNTYTSISLYNSATSDTTALQIYAGEWAAGGYYIDGLVAWVGFGNAAGGAGSAFSITDVASGRTKALYDPKKGENDGFANHNNNRTRRSFGVAKDKNGDYWAIICNYKEEGHTQSKNYWACTNMGSDPKTTYIPHSKGATAETSAKETVLLDMYDAGENEHMIARRLGALHGQYHGCPRGAVVWSPQVVGKLYFYGARYSQTSDTGTGNSSNLYHFYSFDVNKIGEGASDIVTRYKTSKAFAGAMELVADTEGANWGTIDITTKGILTT